MESRGKMLHNLDEISDAMVSTQGLKSISGPVYLTEEARHKYGEFIKQVEGKILQCFT